MSALPVAPLETEGTRLYYKKKKEENEEAGGKKINLYSFQLKKALINNV